MTALTNEEAALAAAHAASEAVAELLRFYWKGAICPGTSFADDVVGKLAEAASLAAEIKAADADYDPDGERAAVQERLLRNLHRFLVRFHEEWEG